MDRVNVITIMSDELTPRALGVYGDSPVRTPGIDELAAGGTTFENAYCNAPVCTPSRYSMLSGRRPWNIETYHNQSPVPSTVPNIATLLGDRGYETIAIGKMHFRGPDQMWGFQSRPYGDFGGLSHQPDPLSTAPRLSFVKDAGPAEIDESELQDVVAGTTATQWLSARRGEKPFYMHLSFNFPHYPLRPPRRLFEAYYPTHADLPRHPEPPSAEHPWMLERRAAYREILGDGTHSEHEIRRARAAYYACVELVDEQIRRLLATLATAGLDESTAIFFMADHGEMLGEHGTWEKNCFYEQAVRVPLIVRLPNRAGAGRHASSVVELVDVMPTIDDLTRPPGGGPGADTDGESLLPVITGEGQRNKDYAISELCPTHVEGVARMVRQGRWKYIVYDNAPPSLFDLDDDPDERHDLGLDQNAAEIADPQLVALADFDLDRVQRRSKSGALATHPLYLEMTPNQYRDETGRLADAETFYADDVVWKTPIRPRNPKVTKVRPGPPESAATVN